MKDEVASGEQVLLKKKRSKAENCRITNIGGWSMTEKPEKEPG